MRRFLKSGLKVGLGVLCGYEVTALVGLPWPPVTTVVHAKRDESLICRLVVWGCIAATTWHLLVEGRNLEDLKIVRLMSRMAVPGNWVEMFRTEVG